MKSKLWKRLITAALATGMIFSLTACGGEGGDGGSSGDGGPALRPLGALGRQ